MAALHRHSPRAVRRYRPPSDLMLQAANDRFGRFIASHHVNVRLLRISLKKPSSIPSDGEACGVSEKGLEGLFGRQLLPPPWRYAASISGSLLIGLKRARRLRF